MGPKDLDYTLTFKLADDGVKTIDELTKQQLEEAKKIIEKRLEDYEEPKKYWVVDYISCGVVVLTIDPREPEMDNFNKQIGNYFETREEAEKAVEKLKAWKRLRDNGFKFDGYYQTDEFCDLVIITTISDYRMIEDMKKDLDILFGGEE